MMNNQTARAVMMALFMSLLFTTFLSGMTFNLKGMDFKTEVSFYAKGITEIQFPPVGSITAHTHWAPLKLKLVLQNIDLDELQQLIDEAPAPVHLIAQLKDELRKVLYNYVRRLLFLAALGGLLGAALICGRQLKPALWGAAAGLLLSAALISMTLSSYQVEKLKTPEYHGALRAAPWVIDMAEAAFNKFNLLGDQMQVIAANLYAVFEKIERIKPLEQEKADLLVLHVSDIHNNPAAHRLIQQIVKSFPVDLIIDTGDITDYGTPLESRLLTGLADLKVPYVFIPGNHDSPEIKKILAAYPQVQVLSGGIIEIHGLRILGMADPASSSRSVAPPDPASENTARAKLLSLWEEAETKPCLVAVHNFNLAEPLAGMVPLILYGHSHQYMIGEEKGTVLVNAGTTGGAGLRGLQVAKEIPYSVVLLYFQRDEKNELRLAAADTIKIYNWEKGFTLERKLFSR
ncbi:MAG: metallophosphoesterase [Peptococcaceae bacterium]|jgi:predicted phosphodiesterase|nr:metallophosphoesterase [Peptococcaceae bacterium]MDH7524113.1 metallophosphoesterase [Peptococcaceae bacterium]